MSERRFTIGPLAERAGVSRDTIRYYERTGVLPEPERTRSGYRLYGEDDVERLAFVAQAQTLGLALDEIREVLEMVDEGREPCVHVRERLRERLGEVREKIRELRRLESRLQGAIKGPSDGAASGDACRCEIIETSARSARTSADDSAGREGVPGAFLRAGSTEG